MNRHPSIPTAPSRRRFLAVLSAGAASAVAPAALAAPLVPVAETALSGLPASLPGIDCADAEKRLSLPFVDSIQSCKVHR
jgi:hypothetical protein